MTSAGLVSLQTYSIGYEPDSWNEVTFDSATVTTRDSRQPPNPLSSRATSGPILFAGEWMTRVEAVSE